MFKHPQSLLYYYVQLITLWKCGQVHEISGDLILWFYHFLIFENMHQICRDIFPLLEIMTSLLVIKQKSLISKPRLLEKVDILSHQRDKAKKKKL
jgi:hypothetical protein